ncbi:MAG TPA: sugar nucleotide-binding protein [Cellvibrio sp.]|nr:sugar nucleotide-binding protein [Cellvibrio sp.]
MSFTLLLTDVTSPLGKALEHELEREPFKLLVPGEAELDWADSQSFPDYLQKHQPDLVLNCCGWDEAVNGAPELLLTATRQLTQACGAAAIPLLQFSSYSVFGGDAKGTHSERDSVAPLNESGRAFVEVERLVAELVPKHIILRLSWVIGAYGDNLLTRLLRAFLAGESVSVNRRLRGAPTALSDAVRVAVAMSKQIYCGAENWGVMHYCSSDSCTEDEFAEQLLQLLIQQQLLTAEPSLSLVDSDPLDEPLSAILGCRRARDYFGIQARSWRPSLLPLVKQWLHNREQGK